MADRKCQLRWVNSSAYHQYLRPLFFEPYAIDLAARCARPADSAGVRVPELAAGTGILTRHLRASLSPGSTLVATDLSDGMIEIGKQHVPEGPGLTWQEADATSLPLRAPMRAHVISGHSKNRRF